MMPFYADYGVKPALGDALMLGFTPGSGDATFERSPLAFAKYVRLDASASEALLAADQAAQRSEAIVGAMTSVARLLLERSRPIEPKYGAVIRKRFWELV